VGFPHLEEVGELRRRGVKYTAAVPVLLEWLPRVSYLMLSDDIVRTLSVAFAKKLALPVFLQALQLFQVSGFRYPAWCVGPKRAG
jgi:hypothetical protein